MDEVTLTAPQRDMLLYHRMFPADTSFTMVHLELIRGQVDLPRLRDALEFVLTGSTGLNLVFHLDADGDKAHRHPGKPVVPIVAVPETAEEQAWVVEQVRLEGERPRPPEEWPLYHLALYQGREHAYLAMVCSHLVGDAVTMFNLVDLATKLYNEEPVEEYLANLTYLPVDQLSPKRQDAAVEAFAEMLRGMPRLDHEGLAVQRQRGGAMPGVCRQESLPDSLDRVLRESEFVKENGPYTVFLAAYALTLASLAGRPEVAVGVPMATRRDWKQMFALGYFINTLPLALNLTETPTFDALCATINTRLRTMLKHRFFDFNERAADVLGGRGAWHPDNAITYYRKAFPLELPGCATETLFVPRSLVRYPLSATLRETDENFVVSIEYAERFAAADPLAMITEVLGAALADPLAPLSGLRVLGEQAEARIDRLVNDYRPGQSPGSVDEWFTATARQHADRVALADPAGEWTYAELDAAVSRVAAALTDGGHGPHVAVAMRPRRELIAVLLGVLRAGRAYVPIDPAAPPERVAHILGQFEAISLIAEETALPSARVSSRHRPEDLLSCNGTASSRPPAPEDLAYLIFTSGSTGVPKGVRVSHGNLTALFTAAAGHYDFGQDDVWCLFHSYAFDFSVWEMLGALLHGGKLIIPAERALRSPVDFAHLLADTGVTVLNQTPSAFRRLTDMLDEATAARLAVRWVVFGGEALRFESLRPWLRLVGERARLVNMYGITESTVHTTFFEITPELVAEEQRSVIGKPLAHLRLHVVDRDLNPCPIGVAGEILVAGDGVAQGYFGNPELTAERFPADTRYGRVYRSGDRGYVTEQGDLVYLDRVDRQVQLRGYRIEPGEVEHALATVPGIAQAHVGVHLPEGGEPLLTAWLVPESEAPADAELRGALTGKLPAYLLPQAFVRVETLPLTVNGKVDTAALPKPGSPGPRPAVAEDGPGGWRAVAAIWAEVIGIETVGPDDSFFEVGGTSMHLVRAHRRLTAEHGADLDIVDLFQYPTPRLLAARLGHAPDAPLRPGRPGNRRARPVRQPVARAHRGGLSREETAG
ncbi:non-ribosomal peptide synthetase [Crossiella sp. NPDC003009]